MLKFYPTYLLLLLALLLSACIESSREAPPALAKKYAGSVVLYATHWCGYCQKTREFFAANHIAYTEHDIEASPEAHREFTALGGKGIPLVLVDGRVVEGYAPKAILEVLRDNNK